MNEVVKAKFEQYPDKVHRVMVALRNEILSLAIELDLAPVEESLKWGQLTFTVPSGSPFRIDWLPESPDKILVFFHCQTKLVATFRELYPEKFIYHGNRAVELPLCDSIASPALVHCLTLALTYKKIKHLPLLGA